MTRALLFFGAVGGLGVPIAFTLASWMLGRIAASPTAALGFLRDVQLPLWPMSKLIIDDPSGRHWLYVPLAALLSNALIYAMVGAASAWTRTRRGAFGVLLAVVVGLLYAASRGFGASALGFAAAALFAVGGLVWHHRSPAS